MLTNTLRLSLVLACAAVLTLAGLSRPRVADAQATTNTINQTIPINAAVFVPCANGGAGEVVTFTGGVHSLVHTTTNDNHMTGIVHTQPQGLSGVGVVTGDVYRVTGGSQQTLSFQSDGHTLTGTATSTLNVIGPGPDNNLLMHSVLHGTLIDGELITSVSISNVECR